jgi:hypothetical protein
MTAKEKAIELYNKFWDAYQHDPGKKRGLPAYEGAVICVNEILEALEQHTWQNKDWIKYYKEVKKEINKL